jgi:oligopeptide transport system substrate-binding protein
MRGGARPVALAGSAVLAVLAAACVGSPSRSEQGVAASKIGGSLTVSICNPREPLVPPHAGDACGMDALDAMTAKLVHYNAQTAAPENDIAESIETTDNQNFTVRLVKDYKFHDGTEVKAKNFVSAWNFAAYGPNALDNGYYMEPIEGYADTRCSDADCTTKPRSQTMSGLRVVDDHTFTIKTSIKVSNLPLRLAYAVFAPLPDSFFRNPKSFEQHPIGAGPFKFDSWVKSKQIKVSRFAEYSGKYEGTLDAITFKIYANPEEAYADVLANRLDVTQQIPAAVLLDDTYRQDLPGRSIQKVTGNIQVIEFPPSRVDPDFSPVQLRKAISMAIDRGQIVKQIFNNTRKPASGWVSPVVDGYKPGACGVDCTFNPARAKGLYQESGGFPGGAMTLSYNADSMHKDWIEATCSSITSTLGVPCVASPVVDFRTFRTQIIDRKMKGMFRASFIMDYPSIENFLAPIYRTGAPYNDGDYSDPAFDRLVDEAAAQIDSAAANAKYQEAEAILDHDFPSIPLWYEATTFGWSTRVTNVRITPFGTVDCAALRLK